jgi:formate dehydrogenase major subunit
MFLGFEFPCLRASVVDVSFWLRPCRARGQPALPIALHNLKGGQQMLRELLSRWPVVKQIKTGGDGTGPEAMSEQTRNLGPRTAGAEVARSVCPYCGVGCGQLIYHKNNKLVSIEGDPESPISRGRLCPKGADSYELLTHANRELKVKYRKPFSRKWESLDLETAMDMIADRLWDARERSFVEKQDGQTLMQTKTVAHLGGATLDNEENYLIKKMFTGGLGMVCISNQARI